MRQASETQMRKKKKKPEIEVAAAENDDPEEDSSAASIIFVIYCSYNKYKRIFKAEKTSSAFKRKRQKDY